MSDPQPGDVVTHVRDGVWKNRVHGSDETLPGSYSSREEAAAAGNEEANDRGVGHLVAGAAGADAKPRGDADPPGDHPD